jgi:hypothetical protein
MQSQPYNLFRNQAPEEVLLGSLPVRMIPKGGVRFSDKIMRK